MVIKNMNSLEFLFNLLELISKDIIVGFIVYIIYKYLDLKYFSSSEIELLRQENEYLKSENKKIGGTSTNFWDK